VIEAGKDYSFLLSAPGQLEELFKAYGVTLQHPVCHLPSAEWVVQTLGQPNGRQVLEEGLTRREKLIKLMEADPLNYGFKPQTWKDLAKLLETRTTVMVTGPNRGAKTEGVAEFVCRLLVRIPRARVWCACETHETSIRGGGQQEVVWKYLPREWKALNHKRSDRFSISYNPKNRFADDAFIAPNGSECRFMNYEQDIGVIEGGAIDFFWFDEDAPVEWVITAEGRLVDRRGHGAVSYTPTRGWNSTYGLFAQGGEVLEWQEFPLFRDMVHYQGGKPGMIPYIIQSMAPTRAMIFFRPNSNPFVSWDGLVKQWSSSSYDVQMMRLAGLTKKKTGNKFPKFGKAHIIPRSKIPAEGTNYHVLDFAWARNWAQIWARVVAIGDKRRIFIYRDWPDKKSYGEWVVPSRKPNGERGPAQSPVGLGIAGYRKLIYGLEGWKAADLVGQRSEGSSQRSEQKVISEFELPGVVESQRLPVGVEVIFKRLGDPRSGKAEAITEEGGTCIIDQMTRDSEESPGMEIVPAKGVLINEGVNILNDWFDYDDDKPVDIMNEPELFVCEECEQVIDCLQLWTGQGSEKEQASKDFIDLLRYLATENPEYVAPGSMECTGGC
jgi:hypothetical protein